MRGGARLLCGCLRADGGVECVRPSRVVLQALKSTESGPARRKMDYNVSATGWRAAHPAHPSRRVLASIAIETVARVVGVCACQILVLFVDSSALHCLHAPFRSPDETHAAVEGEPPACPLRVKLHGFLSHARAPPCPPPTEVFGEAMALGFSFCHVRLEDLFGSELRHKIVRSTSDILRER